MPGEPKGNYRLLTDGEIVEVGDESLNDDCESWTKVVGWNVGRRYHSGVLVPFRRGIRLATTPQAD